MKIKNKILVNILIASSFLTTQITNATPKENFSNVISFGDSFTTPSNSWAALLTDRYGFQFTNGKTNFSVDGTTTAYLATELANYKASSSNVDPNALYLVYMGPNDMDGLNTALLADFVGAFATIQPTEEQILSVLNGNSFTPDTNVVTNNVKQNMGWLVQNLTSNGASYIVILNHFNEYYRQINSLPLISANSQKLYGNLLSKIFNDSIYSRINQLAPDANVIYADYARLVEEISLDASQYISSSDIVTREYPAFDEVGGHPTAIFQKITAQYVASIIESPGRVAYARELPISIGSNLLQNIHNQAYNSVIHKSTENCCEPKQLYTVNLGVDYLYNLTKTISRRQLGIKNANTIDVYTKFNCHINEHATIGLQLMATTSKIEFKDNGKADIQDYLIAVTSTYKLDDLVDHPIFIYGGIGAGIIKYDIKRQIKLGLATRTERGKPSGVHYLATIGAGYHHIIDNKLSLTPFININYQFVSLKSYIEDAMRSTTMSFNIPNRESVISEIGTTIENEYNINENLKIMPSLTLIYGYEFSNTLKKHARAKVSDMPRYFSIPTYQVDKSYLIVNGELRANMHNIDYGARAGTRLSKRTMQLSFGLFAKINL